MAYYGAVVFSEGTLKQLQDWSPSWSHVDEALPDPHLFLETCLKISRSPTLHTWTEVLSEC